MPRGFFDSKRPRKDCLTKCEFPVGVDVDVKPDVQCRQLSKRGTEFDIAVDFDVKPNCCVELKDVHKDKCGCVTRCVWTVKVDIDCHAKVLCNPCGKPSAEFLVLAEIEAEPNCRPQDTCRPKKKPCPPKPCKEDSDSSSSSSSESECDCHDCRRDRGF